MHVSKNIFVLIFIYLSFSLHAQNIKFDNYTTKDGLVSDEVYNLHQDANGYIWLFTNYGTMTYNGKLFKKVLNNLPFNESFIYSFYENKYGNKWIANSNAKIYEIINDSAFIVKGTEIVSETLRKSVSEIYQLYVDDSLNIYVSTKGYSYKFIKSKKYKAFCLNKKNDADSILWQVNDFGNQLVPVCNFPEIPIPEYLVNKKEIKYRIENKSQNKRFDFFVKSDLMSRPRFFKRYGEDIYFSTNNTVHHLDRGNKLSNINLKSLIFNFTKDKNNHLWIACFGDGLYELNEKDEIVNHYFENITVNDVLCDSQNRLWISTVGSGMFHSKGLNETYFLDKNELTAPISFIKKIDHTLYISNINGDIFTVDGMSEKLKKIDISFNIQPHDVLEYNNKLIVSGLGKINFYKKFKEHYVEINKKNIIASYAYKFIVLPSDSIIFLQRKGFTVFCKGNEIDTINFNYKTHCCFDRERSLLFGTDNGVYEYKGNEFVRPDYLSKTENCIITKMIKDDFGILWISTKGNGVFKLFPNNVLVNYTELNGLPSNIINEVSFTNDKGVLLSTNKGLYYINYYNLNFNSCNILYSGEVKSSCYFNNKVYLATHKGLVIIDEAVFEENQFVYFNFLSVLVNDKNSSLKKIDNLNYFENNLVFNFDVISYSQNIPEIKYQLFGIKKYFGTIDKQQIVFQNLPAGNYTLSVSLNVKESLNKQLVFPFTIHEAYWKTSWFIIMSIFIIFTITLTVILFYLKYKRNKEMKIEKINKLITEYKLIALKAQINPHFMSNCLTAIQHLIISNKVDEANQYIAKFSLLVRQVLNFSTKSLVSLKEELEITKINIELEQLRFENKFVFEIILDKNINSSEIFIPPLIIQPITENAIWHGLLKLKNLRPGKLLIRVFIVNNELNLVIEDNGVGRSNLKTDIGNIRESKGMAITQQRIDNINSFYNSVTANLIYDDLKDSNNHAIGTKVTIVLPLNLNISNS